MSQLFFNHLKDDHLLPGQLLMVCDMDGHGVFPVRYVHGNHPSGHLTVAGVPPYNDGVSAFTMHPDQYVILAATRNVSPLSMEDYHRAHRIGENMCAEVIEAVERTVRGMVFSLETLNGQPTT